MDNSIETGRVKLPGKEIVLIGTAHVSEKSTETVRRTIAKEKPQAVGIELCRARYAQLKQGRRWRETNILEVIRRGQTYLFLVNLLLANFQRKIGQELGVKAGQEMVVAAEIAVEHGIAVELIDRDVQITLRRAMQRMGLLEKLRFAYSLIMGFFGDGGDDLTKEGIEALKKKDVMSQLMEELAKELPSVKQVLVDERDAYIAQKILGSKAKKIVAVVGAGHVEGIKKLLVKPRGLQPLAELEKIPKKKNYLRMLKFAVPVAFVALLAYGFAVKGIGASIAVLFYWILINGILAAIGALLARGSALAVLAAFLAAPFTSLHPMFAAGWFAGLAQARSKMPKVKDFEGLRDLNSYSDFTKNPVTRILLVTAYANVGSTIGTIVALPYILSLLA